MATTWALTAEEIVDQACFNLGLAQMGQSVRPAHRATGLRLLNGILKRMPAMGYLWPKTSDSEWAFTIAPGGGVVALPTDFESSPIIKLFLDECKDGPYREDDATGPGELDSGQPFVEGGSNEWGVVSGALYATASTDPNDINILGVDSGLADCEVGATLSTNSSTQDHNPGIFARYASASNTLGLLNMAGTYKLLAVVEGTPTVLKTYSGITPASGDTLALRMLGPAIIAIINGNEQAAAYCTDLTENTIHGIGTNTTTTRFKHLYVGSGKEYAPTVKMAGAWHDIENQLDVSDYPTSLFIDSANQLRAHPTVDVFVRGRMFYQAKLDDTATNTAPDLPADMHLTLVHMVTDELSFPTGRRALGQASEKKWKETLPEQIAFHVDQGDAEFTYDE